MSDLRSLSVIDQHALLTKKGAALGITSMEVMDLIIKFGPLVVDLLMSLLEHRRKLGAQPNAPLPTAIGDNMLKQLFIDFLKKHETDIESWLNSGEGVLYDSMVKLIGGQSQMLADFLKKYRDTVVALDDTATQKILDDVIASLSGNTPAPTPPQFIPSLVLSTTDK